MILYVDDEPSYVEDYIDDLRRSGYDVVAEKSVDKAWSSFQKNSNKIQLLVLDLMMASGTLFKSTDTHGGMWTGVNFYDRVRGEVAELPIIILTNLSEDQIEEKFRDDKKCRLIHKEEISPLELPELVAEVLGGQQQEPA